jgi:hypothetical protein
MLAGVTGAALSLTPTAKMLALSVWCSQLVEGATLLLGAAACLLVSLGPLWVRAPSLGLALLLGLMLSGMEGFLTGDHNLTYYNVLYSMLS